MYEFQHLCCLYHVFHFGFLALHLLWDTAIISLVSSSLGPNTARPLLWGATANPFSSLWALLSAQNQLEFLDLFLGCWRTLEDSQSPCMPEPATFPVLSAILGRRPHPLSCCHQKFQMQASRKFFLPLAPQLQGRSIILPWDSAWGGRGRNSTILVFNFYSSLPNHSNPPWLEASFSWFLDNNNNKTEETQKQKPLFFLFTFLFCLNLGGAFWAGIMVSLLLTVSTVLASLLFI